MIKGKKGETVTESKITFSTYRPTQFETWNSGGLKRAARVIGAVE